MTKVVKLRLICEQLDKNGEEVKYTDIYKILFGLQDQTRTIKNKTVQICWENMNWELEYKQYHGEYPSEEIIIEKYHYKDISGYVNDKFKKNNELYSSNCSTTTRSVCTDFDNSKKDILKGDKSILFYKSNQPLDLHNKAIHLTYLNNDFYVNLNLLNKIATKKYNFAKSDIKFKILVRDNSTNTILERCIDGIYKISASKLIYNKKKKAWFLNLCYSFENKKEYDLDKHRILGVDLGVKCPVYASVYGEYTRFSIQGNEIDEFRKRVESRRISLLKQGRNCGDGRIGHGIKTRNKPAYNIEDKIARFRNTVNHKYSRALIDFAVKEHCGTIQMEDLSGIGDKSDKFLKNWTYYDLQQKVEYKAKEKGIDVKYIKPKYTSQRCSKCGYIDKENRENRDNFICLKCGYKAHADYNASQNISIENIDKIIEEEINQGANAK